MAEDDDDDGFGDFSFASFNPSSNSHQQSHHQSNGFKSPIATPTKDDDDDDDEWGDFIETPLGSFSSSNNTPSKPSTVVDSFHFFSHNQNPASPLQNSESGNSAPAQLGPTREEKNQNQNQGKNKNGLAKRKGAIPLSIFGDVEEEEEVGRSGATDPHHINGMDFTVNKKIDKGSELLKSNSHLGVSFGYNAITSLYNQQSSTNSNDNGVGLPVSGFNFGTNAVDFSKKYSFLELSGLNMNTASTHKRSDSDSVVNLSSQSLQRKAEVGVNASTDGMNLNLNALNLDFSGWNADFNGLNAKASLNLDLMKTVDAHSLQSRDAISNSQFNSNGIDFGVNDIRNSHFDGFNSNSDVMESRLLSSSSKTNGAGTALNFNVKNEELAGSEAEDDDEWEFTDAYAPSQVSHGNGKVRHEVGKSLQNNTMSELGNGTNKGTNLFTANASSDLFSMSSGFPSKTDWFNTGLDNRSSGTADNNFASVKYLNGNQTGSKATLDPHLAIENPETDEDFGEFAAAYVGTGEMPEADTEVHESSAKNEFLPGFDGSNGSVDFSAFNGSVDLFVPSNGKFHNSNEVNVRFGTNPVATANAEAASSSDTFDMPLRREHIADEGLNDPHLVIESAESNENFGKFGEALVENALKKQGELKTADLTKSELETPTHDGIVQEKETRLDPCKSALPLSIFGDEEQEVGGSLNTDDIMLRPAFSKGNGHGLNSAISINDIISNLYSQAEQISSSNPLSNQVVNGLDPSESVSTSNPVNDADDDDDFSSWEFKDSFTNGGAEIWKSFRETENAHERSSVKLKIQNYVDFYSKLKDQLYVFANVHLESLKETQSTAVSSEDENFATVAAEIEEACKELGAQSVITKDDNMGYQREINLNDFVEVLQEPKLHILQTAYDLERKILLVEKDVRSVIELIKHAKTMVKILTLGSFEEQSSYVSIWSKMISACAQELQHGALLWRQSLQKNIHTHILTEPQGKTFVLALGEIYRAAVLLGATVKLYKPWVLLSPIESSRVYSLLEECHSSWSSSGLEEALSSILDAAPSEGYLGLPLIMDSIKYIDDLDELALQNHVFVQQEPLCRLSLLPSSVAPGMAMVDWDGERCFLRLANLWANLVSTDHPEFPYIHVNG